MSLMQLESLNLFIVDESRAFLAGVGLIVAPKVARLETFTSVKEAFVAMTAAPPDLLVTDIEAPDLNGIGLIRKIRAEPLLGALPILVLTGKEDSSLLLSAIEAGADAWLHKNSVRLCMLPQVLALVRLRTEIKTLKSLLSVCKHDFGNAIAAVDGKMRKFILTFPEMATDDSLASIQNWVERMAEMLKKIDELRKQDRKTGGNR